MNGFDCDTTVDGHSPSSPSTTLRSLVIRDLW